MLLYNTPEYVFLARNRFCLLILVGGDGNVGALDRAWPLRIPGEQATLTLCLVSLIFCNSDLGLCYGVAVLISVER